MRVGAKVMGQNIAGFSGKLDLNFGTRCTRRMILEGVCLA